MASFALHDLMAMAGSLPITGRCARPSARSISATSSAPLPVPMNTWSSCALGSFPLYSDQVRPQGDVGGLEHRRWALFGRSCRARRTLAFRHPGRLRRHRGDLLMCRGWGPATPTTGQLGASVITAVVIGAPAALAARADHGQRSAGALILESSPTDGPASWCGTCGRGPGRHHHS